METETSNKEDDPVFLDRSCRPTRGKRMNKLLDEEIEEDELFWNQDALKDEENDDNYEEEPEVADEFDSDFDEDEPEPDEEGENEVDERVRTKKRLIFPGKPLTKKKKKKKILSKLDSPDKDIDSTEHSTLPENHDVPDDAEGERIIRKSTRTAVIVRQAERDAIRAALQATMKPIKRKKEGEEKRMTQEEMLLEAAQTEIMNLRNLERVLAREEEVKKRAIVHKAVFSGPQIRYLSKDGYSYLEFSKGASFQSGLSTTSVPFLWMRVVVFKRQWTWESCLIHFQGMVLWPGGEDQSAQIKMKIHISGTRPVFVEFQLLKLKIQISQQGKFQNYALLRIIIYYCSGDLNL